MARTKNVPGDDLTFRSLELSESAIDAEQRAVEGIAATENPVDMPDFERLEMVPEVLLMSGVRFPATVPLLKDHKRRDSDAVVGSAMLRVEGGQLLTSLRFSKADSVADVWTKVEEKHLRALSVGYKPLKRRYVPRGRTEQIAGRSFAGPVNVVTSWAVREVSVTPIGADEMAMMRGFQENPFAGETKVKLSRMTRLFLESRGMPKDLDDAATESWLRERGLPEDLGERSADEWVEENENRFAVPAAATTNAAATTQQRTAGETVDADAIAKRAVDAALKAFEERQAAEQSRIREFHDEVRATCELAGYPHLGNEFCERFTTLKDVREELKRRRAEEDISLSPFAPSSLRYEASAVDKCRDGISYAVVSRALNDLGAPDERRKEMLPEKPPIGAENFTGKRLLDIGRQCLELEGVRTRSLRDDQVAIAALGFGDDVGVRSGQAFHTSAMFPDLLRDVVNKSMLLGYKERDWTWQQVFRRAPSVKDFKKIYKMRLSEAPNPHIWPDNTVPKEVAFTDDQISYGIEAYAEMTSFSWRLLVNDDMDALTRVPQLMGTAAARKVNEVMWSMVTSNPTLEDGQPLFSNVTGNRKQDNTGAGTLTVANLGAGRKVMRLMTGMTTPQGNASPAILNLEPRFLVVPAALETSAQQLLNSAYDPVASTFQKYNPFGAGNLKLVVEPLLDASSSTIWYLFASTSQIDTIEISFLAGQETPVTSQWQEKETWSRKYMLVQSYGAKAVDYRGVYQSDGVDPG